MRRGGQAVLSGAERARARIGPSPRSSTLSTFLSWWLLLLLKMPITRTGAPCDKEHRLWNRPGKLHLHLWSIHVARGR